MTESKPAKEEHIPTVWRPTGLADLFADLDRLATVHARIIGTKATIAVLGTEQDRLDARIDELHAHSRRNDDALG